MADIGFTPEDVELMNMKYDVTIDELNLKLKRMKVNGMEIQRQLKSLEVNRQVTTKKIEEIKQLKEDLKNREVKE